MSGEQAFAIWLFVTVIVIVIQADRIIDALNRIATALEQETKP